MLPKAFSRNSGCNVRREVTAQINLAAISHNFSIVKQHCADQNVWVMVKADGYGHGAIQVAKALPDADAFGVATLEGAIILRNQKITRPIFVMCGIGSPNEIPLFLEYDIGIVIHHPIQIEWLKQHDFKNPLSVWIKINTGMNRLGMSQEDSLQAIKDLSVMQNIKICGVMTHLADADDQDKSFTKTQLQQFFLHAQDLPKSIANSAAILAYPEAITDWVRPGIMIYGVSPFKEKTGSDFQLKPVMTLQAHLIAINEVKKGAKIGYGCTYECPRDMTIGVVGIGYGDGYPRHAKNGTPVLVGNQICPIVGRVSMDMITVDLTEHTHVEFNDAVTLWGEKLPVEIIAHYADTIAYELLCKLTSRVKYIY